MGRRVGSLHSSRLWRPRLVLAHRALPFICSAGGAAEMPLWESSRFSFPGHDGLSPGGKQPQALHSARPPRGQESLELAGPVGTMTWLEAVIVQTGSDYP